MNAISQTTFSCAFSSMKIAVFFIKFSLKYVRNGPIDNNPALIQIMAWRGSGDKPLSEPMMISLPTHICVTRPQWVKTSHTIETYFSVQQFCHQVFSCFTIKCKWNSRRTSNASLWEIIWPRLCLLCCLVILTLCAGMPISYFWYRYAHIARAGVVIFYSGRISCIKYYFGHVAVIRIEVSCTSSVGLNGKYQHINNCLSAHHDPLQFYFIMHYDHKLRITA